MSVAKFASVGFFLVLWASSQAKIFSQDEVVTALRDSGLIAEEDIPKYVCIGCHETRYNSSAIHIGGHYGLFQFTHELWCQEDDVGGECEVKCSDLADDDLTDDIKCLQKVPVKSWPTYEKFCAPDPYLYRFGHRCTMDEAEYKADPKLMWCPTCVSAHGSLN
eukprot:maker-scaffold23_size669530-snap-gene-3.10 protein:Tk11066 transcript:maker-scaffold23_size669530-snap-gene-3.10-mRNA-1 annotation:"af249896_1alpha lactalbumin"